VVFPLDDAVYYLFVEDFEDDVDYCVEAGHDAPGGLGEAYRMVRSILPFFFS
jgi:hypothetical protein